MFETYESLPRKVRAVQFTDQNKDRVFRSIRGRRVADFEDGLPILKVETIHGEQAIVRLGDWIVEESTGDTYYPVKDHVFRASYVV